MEKSIETSNKNLHQWFLYVNCTQKWYDEEDFQSQNDRKQKMI